MSAEWSVLTSLLSRYEVASSQTTVAHLPVACKKENLLMRRRLGVIGKCISYKFCWNSPKSFEVVLWNMRIVIPELSLINPIHISSGFWVNSSMFTIKSCISLLWMLAIFIPSYKHRRSNRCQTTKQAPKMKRKKLSIDILNKLLITRNIQPSDYTLS